MRRQHPRHELGLLAKAARRVEELLRFASLQHCDDCRVQYEKATLDDVLQVAEVPLESGRARATGASGCDCGEVLDNFSPEALDGPLLDARAQGVL
jgi:hypothetical protein